MIINLRTASMEALAYMESVGQMDMHPEEWAVVEHLRAALNLSAPQPEPIPGAIPMAEYAAKSAAVPGRSSVLAKARAAMSQPEPAMEDCGEAGHVEGRCGNASCFKPAPTVVEPEPQVGETWRILRLGATACATVTVAAITPLTVTFEPVVYGIEGECLPHRNVEFVERVSFAAHPPRTALTTLPEHWVPIGLLGANASFQRAARDYAEQYARAVERAHGITEGKP